MGRLPTPQQIDALAAQARGLLKAGKPQQAARSLAPVIPHAQNHPAAMLTFARAMALLGQLAQSAEVYSRLCEIVPQNAGVRTEYAAVLSRHGRQSEALKEVRAARAVQPWLASAVFQEADLLIDIRRDRDALALIDAFARQTPQAEHTPRDLARLTFVRARLVPGLVEPEEVLDDLLQDTTDERVPVGLRCGIAARAASILDHAGRADEAIETMKLAKNLRKLPWDASGHSARIDGAIQAWLSPQAAELPVSDVDGSSMVFVVGSPRSGSSLLVQILACHPKVQALGERNEITRAANSLAQARPGQIPMVTDLSGFTGECCNDLAREVMASYESLRQPGSERLIDKQPFNYAQLPLLARLLPGCRVIHLLRDPRDTCLSYYMQWFFGPHGQANSLEELGRFYADYRRMMSSWEQLPAPRQRPELLEVHYEQLVTEPEPVLRDILQFMGLEFDEAVLDHTASKRIVNTASRDQVRGALHSARIQRWKRYEKHLAPLMQYVAPYCSD